MSIYNDQSGDYSGIGSGGSHGNTHPFRFDTSTTLALFVIAALFVLGFLHFAFRGGVAVGVGR